MPIEEIQEREGGVVSFQLTNQQKEENQLNEQQKKNLQQNNLQSPKQINQSKIQQLDKRKSLATQIRLGQETGGQISVSKIGVHLGVKEILNNKAQEDKNRAGQSIALQKRLAARKLTDEQIIFNIVEEERRKEVQNLKGQQRKLLQIYVDLLRGQKPDEEMEQNLMQFMQFTEANCSRDYLQELDYNMGDYIFQFPNPDHLNYQEEFKPVRQLDKDKVFKKIIGTIDRMISDTDVAEQKIMELAFYEAFDSLDNYYTVKEQQKLEEIEEHIEKWKADRAHKIRQRKWNPADEDNNPEFELQEFTAKDQQRKIAVGGGFLYREEVEVKQEQTNIKPLNLITNIAKKAINKIQKTSKTINQSLRQINKSQSQIQINQQQVQGDQQNNGEDIQGQIENIEKGSSINNNNNINSNNSSQKKSKLVKSDTKIIQKKKKKIDDKWYYTDEPTKDFLTLIRHFVWLRLLKAGFRLRHFLSETGELIFTVIFASDENLRITAEREQISKALKLEFTDLFSLEPVDKTLRPLRLNTQLWIKEEQSQPQLQTQGENQEEQQQQPQQVVSPHQGSSALHYLKGNIKKLIKGIDFRRIQRECNLQYINSELFQQGSIEINQDEELSNQIWKQYYEYLLFVYENVRKLRQKYKFSYDKSTKISEGLALNRLVNKRKPCFRVNLKKHQRKNKKGQDSEEDAGDNNVDELDQSEEEGDSEFEDQEDDNSSLNQSQHQDQAGNKNVEKREENVNRNNSKQVKIQINQEKEQEKNINNESNKQIDSLQSVAQQKRINNTTAMPNQDNNNSQQQQQHLSFVQSNASEQSQLANVSKYKQKSEQIKDKQEQGEEHIVEEVKDQQQVNVINKKNIFQSSVNKVIANVKNQANLQNNEASDETSKTNNKDNKKIGIMISNLILKLKQTVSLKNSLHSVQGRSSVFGNKNSKSSKDQLNKKISSLQQSSIGSQSSAMSTKNGLTRKQIQKMAQKQLKNAQNKQEERQEITENQQSNAENEMKLLVVERRFLNIRTMLSLPKSHPLHSKLVKFWWRQIVACEYKKIFLQALEIVNYSTKQKNKLQTLWDFVGLQPQYPHSEYFAPPRTKRFHNKQALNAIWQSYIISEKGRVSLFSNMERLKLASAQLHHAINVSYLIESRSVIDIFPLNEYFELFGKSRRPYFEQILNLRGTTEGFEELQVEGLNQQQIRRKEWLISNHNSKQQTLGISGVQRGNNDNNQPNQLSKNDQQSPSCQYPSGAYAGVGSANVLSNVGLLMQQSKKNSKNQQQDSQLFSEKRLNNLAFIWRFQLNCPWYIPDKEIRSYYGEKVALYFLFLGYYTSQLWLIGLLGLCVFVVQQVFSGDSIVFAIVSMAFGIIKIFWCNYSIYCWQRSENEFAMRFGNLSKQQKVSASQERPGFKGTYQRSPIDDNLNHLHFSSWKRFWMVALMWLICIISISIYLAVVLSLFFFTNYLDYQDYPSFLIPLKLPITFPAIINVIFIQFTDPVYQMLATRLTDFENHQTTNDYEQNYIVKRYFFNFMSLCCPLFSISYLNQLIGLGCVNNDCYLHSQYYLGAVFLCLFFLNAKEIIGSLIKVKMKQRDHQKKIKEDNLLRNIPTSIGINKLGNSQRAVKNPSQQQISSQTTIQQKSPLLPGAETSVIKGGKIAGRKVANIRALVMGKIKFIFSKGQKKQDKSSKELDLLQYIPEDDSEREILLSSSSSETESENIDGGQSQSDNSDNDKQSSNKEQEGEDDINENNNQNEIIQEETQLGGIKPRNQQKQKTIKLLKQKLKKTSKKTKKKDKDPYKKINRFIEKKESLKEPFSESLDVYGTVEEYLEMCIQFSLLALFGLIFPLSFIIAFVWNVLEIQTDKQKLIKLTKRPVPQNESSIGSWISILELNGYISIISNSGLITYLSLRMDDSFPLSGLTLFLILLIGNFVIIFTLSAVLGIMPYRIENLIKRHQYVLHSTIEFFKKIVDKNKDKTKATQEDVIKPQPKQQAVDNITSTKKGVDNQMPAEQDQQITPDQQQGINQNYLQTYFYLTSQEKQQQDQTDATKEKDKILTEHYPIFKVFGTLLDVQDLSLQELGQSFEDISSGEEEQCNSGSDVEENNKDKLNQLIKKQNNIIRDTMKQQQNFAKKKPDKKLWMDCRPFTHIGYVLRRLILRQQLEDEKEVMKRRHYKKFAQELINNKQKTKEEAKIILNRKARQAFIFVYQGKWFSQFRCYPKGGIILGTHEIVQKLKEQNEQSMFPDLHGGKEGGEHSKQHVMHHNVQNLKFQEIVRLFRPIGLPKVVDRSYFRYEKWARQLESMLPIRVKKLIVNKTEREYPIFPWIEDKMCCEQESWNLIKIQCQIQFYLKDKYIKLLELLQKKDEKELNELRWVCLLVDREHLFQQSLKAYIQKYFYTRTAGIRQQGNYMDDEDSDQEKIREQDKEVQEVNDVGNDLFIPETKKQKNQYKLENIFDDNSVNNKQVNASPNNLNREKRGLYEAFMLTESEWLRRQQRLMIIVRVAQGMSVHVELLGEIMLKIRNLHSKRFAKLDTNFLIPIEPFSHFNEQHVIKIAYLVRIYSEQYICTLSDIVQEREIRHRQYEEEELLYFTGWLLNSLRFIRDRGLHHSCLTPWNIIQTDNSQRQYKIIGINSLYYYDGSGDQRIYQLREIEEREQSFIAPEIIAYFSNSVKQGHGLLAARFEGNIIQSDLFSAGMVILYMATLGQCVKIMQSQNLTLQEYLRLYHIDIMNKYPITFTVIKQIIEQDLPSGRPPITSLINLIKNNNSIRLQEQENIVTTAKGRQEINCQKHLSFNQNGDSSINHILHQCNTYNKLRMHEGSIFILENVLFFYNNKIDQSQLQEDQKQDINLSKPSQETLLTNLQQPQNYCLKQSFSRSQLSSKNNQSSLILNHQKKNEIKKQINVVSAYITLGQAYLGLGDFEKSHQVLRDGNAFLKRIPNYISYTKEDSKFISGCEQEKSGSVIPEEKSILNQSYPSSQLSSTCMLHQNLSKFRHLQMHIKYLQSWCLFMLPDHTKFQSQKNRALQKLEKIISKISKPKNVQIERQYIASSANNCSRLFSAYKLQIQLLLDMRLLKEVKSSLQEVLSILYRKNSQICLEQVPDKFFTYYRKEFQYLSIILSIAETDFKQAVGDLLLLTSNNKSNNDDKIANHSNRISPVKDVIHSQYQKQKIDKIKSSTRIQMDQKSVISGSSNNKKQSKKHIQSHSRQHSSQASTSSINIISNNNNQLDHANLDSTKKPLIADMLPSKCILYVKNQIFINGLHAQLLILVEDDHQFTSVYNKFKFNLEKFNKQGAFTFGYFTDIIEQYLSLLEFDPYHEEIVHAMIFNLRYLQERSSNILGDFLLGKLLAMAKSGSAAQLSMGLQHLQKSFSACTGMSLQEVKKLCISTDNDINTQNVSEVQQDQEMQEQNEVNQIDKLIKEKEEQDLRDKLQNLLNKIEILSKQDNMMEKITSLHDQAIKISHQLLEIDVVTRCTTAKENLRKSMYMLQEPLLESILYIIPFINDKFNQNLIQKKYVQCLQKLAEISDQRPRRPEGGSVSSMKTHTVSRMARLHFFFKDYKNLEQELSEIVQQIEANFQNMKKKKNMWNNESKFSKYLKLNKLLVQDWLLVSYYKQGQLFNVGHQLLEMFKHFKEYRFHIYLILAINYKMFGYYDNAVMMCQMLLKETGNYLGYDIQTRSEEEQNEIMTSQRAGHVLITILYLSLIKIESDLIYQQFDKASYAQNISNLRKNAISELDILKQLFKNERVFIKSIDVMQASLYEQDGSLIQALLCYNQIIKQRFALSIKKSANQDDNNQNQGQNLNDINNSQIDQEKNVQQSIGKQNELDEEQAVTAEEMPQLQWVLFSTKFALLLLEFGQYEKASKAIRGIIDFCISFCKDQKEQLIMNFQLKNAYFAISDFQVFLVCKLLEIKALQANFKEAQLFDRQLDKMLQEMEQLQPDLWDRTEFLKSFFIYLAKGIYKMYNQDSDEAILFFHDAQAQLTKLENYSTNYNPLIINEQKQPQKNDESSQGLRRPSIKIEQGNIIENSIQPLRKSQQIISQSQSQVEIDEGEEMVKIDERNTSLLEKFFNLENLKIILQILFIEVRIQKSTELIEAYNKLYPLEDFILNFKGINSIYYIHYMKLKAMIGSQILNQNRFYDLQQFQQRQELINQGQASKQVGSKYKQFTEKDIMKSQQNFIISMFDISIETKHRYKKFYIFTQINMIPIENAKQKQDNQQEVEEQQDIKKEDNSEKVVKYDYSCNRNFAQCCLIISNCSAYLQKIYKSTKYLQKSEQMFQQLYDTLVHPDIIRLQFMKGILLEKRQIALYETIGIIMYINKELLSYKEKDFVITQIILQVGDVLKIFDSYRSVQFLNFLINNLKTYIENNQQNFNEHKVKLKDINNLEKQQQQNEQRQNNPKVDNSSFNDISDQHVNNNGVNVVKLQQLQTKQKQKSSIQLIKEASGSKNVNLNDIIQVFKIKQKEIEFIEKKGQVKEKPKDESLKKIYYRMALMICKTLWGMDRNSLYKEVEDMYLNIIKREKELDLINFSTKIEQDILYLINMSNFDKL